MVPPPKPKGNPLGSGRLKLGASGSSNGREYLGSSGALPGTDWSLKRSDSSFGLIPEHVARGNPGDIDWKVAKLAWLVNQIANVPYIITLSMCFTTKRTFQTKPLFDEKHVTMFVWAMGMIVVNSWICGSVIFSKPNRTIRRIAWAQGAAFMVMNLSLMMVVHNGTFVDLDTEGIEFIRWNTFYAGPPEVASQLFLFTTIMGFLNCKHCCGGGQANTSVV